MNKLVIAKRAFVCYTRWSPSKRRP